MVEKLLYSKPDLEQARTFRKELLSTRRLGTVSPALTLAFREAIIASSIIQNWTRVAKISAQYAIRARKVGDEEALLEGVNTFEGAVAMVDGYSLRKIFADEIAAEEKREERRAAKMRQESRKR